MWRGLSGRYTTTMTVMVCLDPCQWSSQSMAFSVSSTPVQQSLSQIRLALNTPCMALVICKNNYCYVFTLAASCGGTATYPVASTTAKLVGRIVLCVASASVYSPTWMLHSSCNNNNYYITLCLESRHRYPRFSAWSTGNVLYSYSQYWAQDG